MINLLASPTAKEKQSDRKQQALVAGVRRRPLSPEGSFIPGETEEDGNLRREYVLVDDTRAVQFIQAVDGTLFWNSLVKIINLSAYPRNRDPT